MNEKIKIENVKGKEICIFYAPNGGFYVRVYGPNNSFKDYAMKFTDLFGNSSALYTQNTTH